MSDATVRPIYYLRRVANKFDIIDETSHAEYGRKWLPIMMERAGIQEDYRKRGLQDRQTVQEGADA